MRILGQIPHPDLNINVFKSGNKFILKFEAGPFEQSYKFIESDTIRGLEDLQNLVHDDLLKNIYRIFDQMNLEYKSMNT